MVNFNNKVAAFNRGGFYVTTGNKKQDGDGNEKSNVFHFSMSLFMAYLTTTFLEKYVLPKLTAITYNPGFNEFKFIVVC